MNRRRPGRRSAADQGCFLFCVCFVCMAVAHLISQTTSQPASQKQNKYTFICTHNSRRSQFTQVWAKIISDYYGFNINSFSGGTEVTNCNTRTIASFERMGFKVKNTAGENPHYELT